MKSSHEEIDDMHDRNADYLSDALARIQVARMRGDSGQVEALTKKLGLDLGRMLAAADLLGRRRMLIELREAGVEDTFMADAARDKAMRFAALTPKVPFWEAIGSILKREPMLVEGWEAARDAWLKGGFALAKSTVKHVTANVQQTILRAMRGGQSERAAVTTIQTQLQAGGTDATRAYADTVFRTTSSSAYQEGRQAQSRRPGVQLAASGWRYVATSDPDVRDNHWAGDNFVAHVDDPVWKTHSPPLGFNCRCSLELVPTEEMADLGISNDDGGLLTLKTAPAGFAADPGFQAIAKVR